MSSVASRVISTMACIALLAASILPVAAQTPGCRFVLGFATLHDLVGAEKVGACLEDEHFNLENGNSEQHTAGGLLVWRKIDNFTAFTDGGTSWVNGPNGLQSRPNSDRFSWEHDPITAASSPTPAGPSVSASPQPVGSPASQPSATAAVPTATPGEQVTTTDGPCDPSYPDFCIPPPPPDVNCDRPVIAGRKNFHVRAPDPHRLDQNGNGIACETSNR